MPTLESYARYPLMLGTPSPLHRLERLTKHLGGAHLVDRTRRRRRRHALHLHDRDLAEAVWGTVVHEHCEEVLGQPTCGHYLGRELPDGFLGIELLMAAWVEPGTLDCSSLICLG